MAYLLLGTGLLLGLYLLVRGLATADPHRLAAVLRWTAVAVGVGVVMLLLVSGRFVQVLYALPLLLPFFLRWRGLLARAKAALGPTPGQSSTIETAGLRMWLDHDSGQMDGEVRAGAAAGRVLSQMSQAELADLLEELRAHDPQSVPLLEAYLDRAHPDWRGEGAESAGAGQGGAGQGGAGAARGGSGGMTRDEAWQVLGLEPGADEAAVKEAHRRLMLKNHPDQGGSTYIAARINQAKDILLGRARAGS
ncbi:DnaJ domain-containing protein [Rhodospirillum centenum]|uniref:Heat shock protein DnaJ, N-terminal, putative n=1 Tax=Rhodospirillum centenum (strain ATCC 51521 / SW) TaxID=414684 RepID=B6INK1_RHOCS|nr:DnaJ domain-containing protein [Rhodospirillum centenum]ACI99098.1 heat shock protein DnaJ, N-terminal, putative [Rhodospirillum centenum SW]